jgi:hypothetical protein
LDSVWKLVSDTTYRVVGNRLGSGCGSAPPIYDLTPILTEVADHSTDRELRDLVTALQTGTREQQEAAVATVADRIFDRLEARPGL